MDGSSMGDDHLGHADIDAKRLRSRTMLRAHLAQIALQGGKGRGLTAARWFAYLAHIDYVKIDEIAKSCET
jgi:hypothetical protein